jgi:hypothetical protein
MPNVRGYRADGRYKARRFRGSGWAVWFGVAHLTAEAPDRDCVPERENLQRFLRHAIVEVVANSAEREPTNASCFRARGRNAETRLG